MMKIVTPNPKLRDFWFTPARYRVLYGGRDSSKSWDAAQIALFIADRVKTKILCTRKFQNRIDESVYALLKAQIERYGYTNFEVQKTKITNTRNGSEFFFYGLARNINEIKSLEGVDILWNEEAQYLTEEDARILIPTIRKERSQIWFIFNPDLETDYVYKNFIINRPDNAVTRLINYDENKWLSQTSLDEIESLKERDYEAYLHVYKGHPRKSDKEAIIPRSWIDTAIDAHTKLDIDLAGAKIVGYDVADSGEDKNAVCYTHGITTLETEQWKADPNEMFQSSERVYNFAFDRRALVQYDSVGVGAGVGSNINQINSRTGYNVVFQAFNAGAKIVNPDAIYKLGKTNRDAFANLKAQAWQNVADRFENTYNKIINGIDEPEGKYISISSNCDNLSELIRELSAPKKQFDSALRMKVESKDDMKKRGIKSPNLADAFIMSNFQAQANFSAWNSLHKSIDRIM